MPITGGCLCGAVRYAIETGPDGLDPARITATFCHCTMCQKATGGPFAALFEVKLAALSWTASAPARYRSSPIATRSFCNACGSPLAYDADTEPHIALTVGSLDDPSVIVPDHHYGVESRLPWLDCHTELPGFKTTEQFEGQP